MKLLFKGIDFLIICILLSTLIFACQKNNAPDVSPDAYYGAYEGKLKTCQLIDSTIGDTITYTFLYDTLSGELRRIFSDTFSLLFENYDANTVRLYYSKTPPGTPYSIIYLAHVSPDKVIQSVSVYNPPPAETFIARRFVFYGSSLDSILDGGFYPVPTNIKDYNYYFDGMNCIKFDFSFAYFIGHYSNTISDSTQLTYTNFLFDSIAPLQQIYFTGSMYYAHGVYDPLYVLGLNGYFPFKHNTNLISTRKEILAMDYRYTFNSNNQITEMRVSPLQYSYRLTYY